MGDQKSAEEAKQFYIKHMGKELGELFHYLWQEFAWIYMKWNKYIMLYCEKNSRIKLMKDSAPLFFSLVQDLLWEETILSIARITDPPKSFGKDNLTIQKITEFIKDEEIDLKNGMNELVDIVIESSDFCRDWRNRRLAHRDLQLAINDGIYPLKIATIGKTKKVLKSITEVLNLVEFHFTGSKTNFEIYIGDSGGVLSLLYIIDDGLKAEAERRNRIIQGQGRKEDFEQRDI